MTAKTPLTRLFKIRPPALAMRFPSFSSLPLWSYDKRSALPLRHRIMRASPTLAVYKTRCLLGCGFKGASFSELFFSSSAGSEVLPFFTGMAMLGTATLWRSLGERLSQRNTAMAAVQPLFFKGSFSSWASQLVNVWSRSSGRGALGFFLTTSSRTTCSFLPHQSAAKVPACPSKMAKYPLSDSEMSVLDASDLSDLLPSTACVSRKL